MEGGRSADQQEVPHAPWMARHAPQANEGLGWKHKNRPLASSGPMILKSAERPMEAISMQQSSGLECKIYNHAAGIRVKEGEISIVLRGRTDKQLVCS